MRVLIQVFGLIGLALIPLVAVESALVVEIC
jgi:hypothetical protein